MKKLILSFILITYLFGCSSNAKTSSNVSTLSSPQTTQSNVATQIEKIKFKTEGGTDLFSLKQQADGAKLVDGNDKEFVRIKSDESGKVKIKNASEKVLGYVVAEKGYWKIENPEQNKDLYIFRRKNNDYQLEDVAKKQVYQIKARNNGFEIETPDKKLVYKVKVKEGKTSLRDASDKTVFSTKSGFSPIAFTCFGLDVLTREQQAGLAYAVNLTKGQ
ncbi:hypothetical protein [Tolypothrix sp. VBCCA 56010]|uniref:hypothetical protein n=1 Tax=Tolypothrix sp. VBCCA 56010 TaxID=3137731 RepID=UPI003D7E5A7F